MKYRQMIFTPVLVDGAIIVEDDVAEYICNHINVNGIKVSGTETIKDLLILTGFRIMRNMLYNFDIIALEDDITEFSMVESADGVILIDIAVAILD